MTSFGRPDREHLLLFLPWPDQIAGISSVRRSLSDEQRGIPALQNQDNCRGRNAPPSSLASPALWRLLFGWQLCHDVTYEKRMLRHGYERPRSFVRSKAPCVEKARLHARPGGSGLFPCPLP